MNERQLQGAGLVLLSFLAAALLVGAGWRSTATAGEGATPAEAAGVHLAGKEPIRHVEIPAGWRAEQVADALRKAGISDGDRFLSRVRRRSLEGYLFPGIYDIGPDFSEESLVAEMAARFREAFTPALRRQARALGLSLHEVVTLASIVQREMLLPSDGPVIAAVFHNRLKIGMPLKANPTVIFAVESERKRIDVPYWQSRMDLRIDSPYNTYARKGLPPGPIASPNLDAITAVLWPADVDYLFFVSRGNGTHDFARTGLEHVANVERYARGGAERRPASELQHLVERLAPGDGHVGVVVKNLATGETAAVNADDFFTSASLYKLAVLLKAFEARDQGKLSFDERLSISAGAAGADIPEVRARLGTRPTVGKAVREMIVVSSNAAGVTLLRKLGRKSVDRSLRKYGLRDTSLSSMRMVTTPRDVARLLELVASRRAVSRRASAEMVEILLRQEIRNRLPKHLPKRVRLAHKTGDLDRLSHDAGILYGRRGPIVIVAMTEATNTATANEAIASLGRFVYDYFESYRPIAERLAPSGNPDCPPVSPRAQGPLSGKTVVLDPGHGGLDPGALFHFRDGFLLSEKAVVLDVARRLRDQLTARGATVHMTRCRDVFLPLKTRAALANAAEPDLVVSLHVNASTDPGKDGTEIYYFHPAGKALANYLLGTFARPALWETLSGRLSLPNLGAYRRQLDVLTFSLAPTALTESAYLTNPAEAGLLRKTARGPATRREQIVQGHLRGILNFFGRGGSPGREPVLRPPRRERPPTSAEVRIVAAGDIAIGGEPLDGGASMFSGVSRYLAGDVVLGNLEGSLARGGRSKCAGRKSSSCFAFRAPPSFAHSLRRAGFDVLSLANNHSGDYGAIGSDETIAALDSAGLLHTGRRGQVARRQAGRVRVAIVGFAPYARVQNLLDIAGAKRLVERADAWADVVVVTMHAGAEGGDRMHVAAAPEVYLGEERGDPVAFAHAVVDSGADLVVGHGPHVLRGMEWYRGRLIAYSLGNFAANETFSVGGPLGVSGILQATLGADGSWRRGRLVSVRLDDGRPIADPAGGGARLVRRLSGEDFGPGAVRVSSRGELLEGSVSAQLSPTRAEIAKLSPRQKAALLVVSGPPVPVGAGGVFVRSWNRHVPRPGDALVFVDQEGGTVKSIRELPPWSSAFSYRSDRAAFAAGKMTGTALRRASVHVDLAPVLDASDGPLGSRHFRDASFGVAFARGLAAGEAGACAKHFPGLGSTPVSTDKARVRGVVRERELESFRAAIRAGVPCVMVGHAVYRRLGRRPASLEPATYRLLRSIRFDGVAITDDLDVLGRTQAGRSARLAIEAGADLVLFSSGKDAERAIDALVPLARQGLLDDRVKRVLRLRRAYGL